MWPACLLMQFFVFVTLLHFQYYILLAGAAFSIEMWSMIRFSDVRQSRLLVNRKRRREEKFKYMLKSSKVQNWVDFYIDLTRYRGRHVIADFTLIWNWLIRSIELCCGFRCIQWVVHSSKTRKMLFYTYYNLSIFYAIYTIFVSNYSMNMIDVK